MSIQADIAKGKLEGIIQGACRNLQLKPGYYVIRPGGERLTSAAVVDYYATIGTTDATINCKRARDERLIRRQFCIYQKHSEDPCELIIKEWNYEHDFNRLDREIWRKLWSQPAAMEMMRLAIEAHKEFSRPA